MAVCRRWLAGSIAVAGLLTAGLTGALAVEVNDDGPALVRAVRDGNRAHTQALIKQKVDVNGADADGATALHWAAYGNDLEMLRLLLAAGARANVANVYGITPLAVGCLNASPPIVDTLLQSGANPNLASVSGETPLMTAARTGNVDVVKALIVAGAAVNASEMRRGQTALMWAAAEGHAPIVRALIQAGAPVDARTRGHFTALMFASQSGDVESVRALLAAGAKLTDVDAEKRNALTVAAGSGHTPLVGLLLERGADPNVADQAGVTPLHAAVWGNFNNVPMIQLLLAHRANPNARTTRNLGRRLANSFYGDIQYRTQASLQGATPYALAAAQADVNAMRALAAGGADATSPLDNGSTPIMLAAGMGWGLEQSNVAPERAQAALEAAVELGGDVNARNAGGRTALHGAANNGFESGLRFLVARGADINAVDGDGWTPLWTAQHAQGGSSVLEAPGAIRVLRELGAREIVPASAKAP